MKALTLTQPWASLVVNGHKMIETRSWRTYHQGWIAIHAGLRIPKPAWWTYCSPSFQKALDSCGAANSLSWPRGAIIGKAYLAQCAEIPDHQIIITPNPGPWNFMKPFSFPPDAGTLEHTFGDYTPGRWAWFFTEVKKLETPIPARGALNLWEWDGEI